MFAHLSADTDLIRAYGSASSGHAADLQTAAARLSAVDASMLGPVGARFRAALTRAAEHEARAVTALGGALTSARVAARDTAHAYEGADAAAGTRLTGTW